MDRDVQVKAADMTGFSFPDVRFGSVFATASSVTLLTGTEEQKRCFRSVYEHLKEGGTFLFDLLVPDYEMVARYPNFHSTSFEMDGTPYRMEIISRLASKVEQTTEIERRVINRETDQIELSTRTEVALLPKQQLELLLEHCGFSTIHFYEPFDLDALLGEDGDRMLCVAEK